MPDVALRSSAVTRSCACFNCPSVRRASPSNLTSVALAPPSRSAIRRAESAVAATSSPLSWESHACRAESARAPSAAAARGVVSCAGSNRAALILPVGSARAGTWSCSPHRVTWPMIPPDRPPARPSLSRGVPNLSPVAVRRSITSFFSSSGSGSRSVTRASAWSRFCKASNGLATVRPWISTRPCGRSRCRRSISTSAPMSVVPTDSAVRLAMRSAKTSHNPRATAPSTNRGTTAFQRNTATRTSGLRPEQAVQIVQLGRDHTAVQRGAFYALGDRGAVTPDAPSAREEQRHPESARHHQAAEHDRVVEARQRHHRRVVERGPQRPQRWSVEQQRATDPVERRVEQEAHGHEQRPPQHRTRERHVQHDDQRERHGVVEIPEGRETEDRSQGKTGGELPGRALGVQGLDERLDQLQQEHGVGSPGEDRVRAPKCSHPEGWARHNTTLTRTCFSTAPHRAHTSVWENERPSVHGTTRASSPVVETRTSNVAGRVAATNVAEPYSASTSGPSRRRRAIE